MDLALGLVGLALYIVAVVAVAGAITYAVVRLTPVHKRDKDEQTASG